MESPEQIQERSKDIEFKNKILYAIGGATSMIALLTIALVLYWLIFPLHVLTVSNLPVKVLNQNKQVVNGGTVLIEVEFCKETNAPGRVNVWLVGSQNSTLLSNYVEKASAGCYSLKGQDAVKIDLPILTNIEPKKIRYEIYYDPNPMRKNVKVDFESETVDILPIN